MNVRRGDVFIADLGSDTIEYRRGIRPVLIVQNDVGNANSDTYIAAIITSKYKKTLPTHVALSTSCGLRKHSVVMCENLVTVRENMLRKYIGTIVNTSDESRVDCALAVSLQLKVVK